MIARANASPAHVAAKHARLREPHVAPLVALADEIAEAHGFKAGDVPYPDPLTGGVHARALFLLSTPGPAAKAGPGSGLLSLENDDPTAARVLRAYEVAGLNIGRCLHWNAVPWPTARRNPTAAEMTAARPLLARLLSLLPELRVVALLGRDAQKCWQRNGPARPALEVLHGPHPSNLGMRPRDVAEARLAAVMARAAEVTR